MPRGIPKSGVRKPRKKKGVQPQETIPEEPIEEESSAFSFKVEEIREANLVGELEEIYNFCSTQNKTPSDAYVKLVQWLQWKLDEDAIETAAS